MKKSRLITIISITILFIISFTSISMYNKTTERNTYSKEWDKIEEFRKKGLPQSAINKIDSIKALAVKEKNIPQIIKAIITRNLYQQQITGDAIPDQEREQENTDNYIFELENLLNQTKSIDDKALLHLILAHEYLSTYKDDARKYAKRTNLGDNVYPEDMKEWTAANFKNKVFEHLDAINNYETNLLNSKTKFYPDIITLGEHSEKYFPTLYDFIAQERLNILQDNSLFDKDEQLKILESDLVTKSLYLPAKEYVKLPINKDFKLLYEYQRYINSLLKRNMQASLPIIEIKKINALGRDLFINNKDLYIALENLKTIYQNEETSVELIPSIYNALQSLSYERIIPLQGENNIQLDERRKEKKDSITIAQYELINTYINKYPNYERINSLKYLKEILETPSINTNINSQYTSSDSIVITFNYKNLNQLKILPILTLYDTSNDKEKPIQEIKYGNKKANKDYLEVEEKINLGKLPYGRYRLKFNDTDYYNKTDFIVSDLLVSILTIDNKRKQFIVTDYKSGKHIPHAKIKLYSNEQKIIDDEWQNVENYMEEIKTNDLGSSMYIFNKKNKYANGSYIFKIENGKDKFLKSSFYYYEPYTNNDEEDIIFSLLTDREYYRPGQTVYLKTYALNKENLPIEDLEQVITLYNQNNEKVGSYTQKSNEFGSTSGKIVLPSKGLNGTYTLKINNKYVGSINVEEYKRPNFEIKFNELNKAYTYNQEVAIKGSAKTFSGTNLQNATVSYTITRYMPYRYFYYLFRESNILETGLVQTDKEGNFTINFTPKSKQNDQTDPFSIYTIEATITDAKGETQANSTSFFVGKDKAKVSINLSSEIEKTRDFKDLDDRTLVQLSQIHKRENLDFDGTYTIMKYDYEDESKTSEISKGIITNNNDKALKKSLKELTSGNYQLKINLKDKDGNDFEKTTNFYIYSFDDKKPPLKTTSLTKINDYYFNVGDTIKLYTASSDKNAYLHYSIIGENTVIEEKVIPLNDEVKTFYIKYKPSFGDKVGIATLLVKDGVAYNKIYEIKRKIEPKKQLTIKLVSFRDKLKPGDTETWTLEVKDPNNAEVQAELLASMYDKSLDQIFGRQQQWYINKKYQSNIWNSSFSYINTHNLRGNIAANLDNIYNQPNSYAKAFEFDKFTFIPTSAYSNKYRLLRSASGNYRIGANSEEIDLMEVIVAAPTSMAARSKSKDTEVSNEMYESTTSIESTDQKSLNSIRSNFNETAFFYPQLKTDEKGNVKISFKVPDSNTKWLFRALATNKKSNYGTLEQEIITQKELMVSPNLPRFFRTGDAITLNSNLSNLSDNKISGKIKLEFFDPITDKIIDNKSLKNQTLDFELEKNDTKAYNWGFKVPENTTLLGIRIIADSENFSDGEQHVIPVLSNKMLVTETLPIDVTQTGENKFTFDKLKNNTSNTLVNHKLSLEFTSNPIWYAIQALPVYNTPNSESTIDWLASFYVNTYAQSLLKSYPEISNMIKTWNGNSKEELASNLSKNQELKTILLEETPWLLEAKNEEEMMQQLSLLLDINSANQQQTDAKRKLISFQDKNNGGMPWYQGMISNRFITNFTLYTLATLQLNAMVEYDADIKQMQIDALKFVDQYILSDFIDLKNNNKDWERSTSITKNQLEYLYTRTFYRDIPITSACREAERFYTEIAFNNWVNMDLYSKSLVAILAKELGRNDIAKAVTASIKEYAINDKELGMYWPKNTKSLCFSMSNVSLHTFLMEALIANGATNEEVNQMKRWLIKQKQTNKWESSMATMDAIGKLVQIGDKTLSDNSSDIKIKVDTKVIDVDNKTLGTEYFITSWSDSEITKDKANITITSKNNVPAYGAMYWQYFEDIDKVTKQDGSLNISKTLYKEISTTKGKELQKISSNNPLKVGDKIIVRLTIRTDRDMEFVQVKDMRASCFEPIDQLSGIRVSSERTYYYLESKDASTQYFFDNLPKGTYVFEYPVYVSQSGTFIDGIASIQSAYAPEFTGHSKGESLKVNP